MTSTLRHGWLKKRTETPEHHILNIWQHFSYDFFLTQVSTMKILYFKLYCILTNKINVRDIVLYMSVRTADTLRWCNLPSARRQDWRCVNHAAAVNLVVSGQELQTVFNNLFITCPARLRVEGGHFQELLLHALSYIICEEMQGRYFCRMSGFVFQQAPLCYNSRGFRKSVE